MKHFLFIATFLAATFFSNAQESVNQPLELVLIQLQNQFEVKFSYPSDLLEDKIINLEVDPLSLKNTLDRIEKMTQLQFVKIAENSFIIKPNFGLSEVRICGYVLDAVTQLPIQDVSVSVEYTSENFNSQSNGYFELEGLNRASRIKVYRMGYKSRELTLNDFGKDCLKIYLEEEVFALNEIVIENYFSKGFVKNRDGSLNVSPKNMSTLPGLVESDVLQSVQMIPGISSPDETATGLNIRGGTPDHNLILFDGIKIYNYDHFFGMLSSFDPNIIEEIKIYKNGGPSKYRSHISGVIDMTTGSKIPKRTSGGIGVNMIFANAYLSLPVNKKLGVTLSARSSFSDVFKTITFDRYADFVFQNTKITNNNVTYSSDLSKRNTHYNFQDYTLKGVYQISPSSQVNLSAIYSKNALDFKAKLTEINQFTTDVLNIQNLGVIAEHQKEWSKRLKAKVALSFSHYNFDYSGKEILDAFFNYSTIKKNEIFDNNAHVEMNYKINALQELTVGFDYVFNDIQYTIGRISDVIFDKDYTIQSNNNKSNTYSVFADYYWKYNNWSLNAGLRNTYFSDLKQLYIQPNFTANFSLNSRINLQGSFQKKNQLLSQIVEFETQNFGLENQVWALSNSSNIPVLSNTQASVGANYKHNGLFVDLAFFKSNTSRITSLTKGFNREVDEFSIGRSENLGIELLAQKEINHCSSMVSYSLSKSVFQFKDLNEAKEFNGNFDIRHHLNLIQTLRWDKLELAAAWRFKSPKPYTQAKGLSGNNAENIHIEYEPINLARLDQYTRFDLSSSYQFSWSKKVKGVFRFSLINVFNNLNNISRYHRLVFDLQNLNYSIRELNKYGIGRTVNASIQLKF